MLLEIVKKVQKVVKTVGAYQRRKINTLLDGAIEQKGINQLVSYVDRESELMLVNALDGLIDGATFLTEEGVVKYVEGAQIWVIDPLDGTINYVHGIPVFSISEALRQGSNNLLGVVYDVMRDEIFWAVKDQGAWLNNKKIGVSNKVSLRQSLIATGFPYYRFDKLDFYMKILNAVISSSRGVRRLGSAAIDLAYLAAGHFDVFFEYDLSTWDVAAGIILAEETGGQVTDFNGGNKHWNGCEVLATNKILHEKMIKLISVL